MLIFDLFSWGDGPRHAHPMFTFPDHDRNSTIATSSHIMHSFPYLFLCVRVLDDSFVQFSVLFVLKDSYVRDKDPPEVPKDPYDPLRSTG